MLLVAGCADGTDPPASAPHMVGSSACADCHPAQHAAWSGTDHARAQGGPDAVLGDLSDPMVAPLVAARPVVGTIGVDPLQQLLVEGEGGRWQVLPVAWDSRPASAGGQRWFAPSEEASTEGSSLHWAHPERSWTTQCAACHVTGLTRRFDAEDDRWTVSFVEAGVGCEACHGAGSAHAADPGVALGAVGPDACARCHALAAPLTESLGPDVALHDGWRVAPAVPPVFFADGQQHAEAFTWASFGQSRKAAAGLRCTTCHEAHEGTLRAALPGLCESCHAAEVYAAPGHHHHAPDGAGADCVACHMPSTTYMGIDGRPDHRFVVPQPGLSARVGARDACTTCHLGRDAAWAQAALDEWGAGGPDPAVAALAEGSAAQRLALAADATVPLGLRTALLARAGEDMGGALLPALVPLLTDPSAEIRATALEALDPAPADVRVLAAPLLADPQRRVRIEAARLVADLPDTALGRHAAARPAARDELLRLFEIGWDSATTRVQRARYHERIGDLAAAEADLESALARDPTLPEAAGALSELLRVQRRDADAERVLESAIAAGASDARLWLALGLCHVRMGALDQAATDLQRAAALAPDDPEIARVQQALAAAGER